MKHMAFKVVAILITLVSLVAVLLGVHPLSWAAFGDRITISNNQFYSGSTKIWINGANTPWDNWNDFGGDFNYSWWDSHFQELHNNGINATRIWITCDGEVAINIDSNGYVSGATQAHWNDLDSLFGIAQNRQVYIMATLMSFDHFGTNHTNYQRWRDWLNSDSNIDSYVNNYLIPFVKRYKNNQWLWSIDLINEPDWAYSGEGGYTSWDRLQMYFAKASRAIHENSSILVTVGMAMPKYSSGSCSGCSGNKVSDSALQAELNDPDVRLDFWQTHYYPWQDPYWGIPFYTTPASYGLETSKLALVGECPATGSTGHTTTQDYEQAYQNGWQGVMAWTSNGVDSNGSLTELGPATRSFRDNHYSLVFPYFLSFADFDGDGATDVAAFHFPTDQFFTDYAGNLGQFGWGGSDSMPLIWDYDGDGKTDVSIYHIPTNQWFVKGVGNLGQYGWGGDESIPVPGDYNGDGHMERAFYHSPTNRWFVEGQDPVTFGWNGAECIPVPGDYDGDGKTDMVIYHIPSNQWFQYGVGELGQFGWGGSDCIPVPGDYNGDGKMEVAVYHIPTNQWFVKGMGNLGQYGWGGLESFPIPGDYNGDGVMERGFYRPSENRWFIEGETDFIWGWGGSDFMPITSQIAVYNWFRFILGRFQ